MNDLIGQQIDNYRIETLLGEGGMGAVYRAQDVHLNRPVALKMISRRLARDPDFQRRFLQEARAAARLKHPSIVQIYHFGARQGSLYMAMAYIPGQTLGTYIRRLQKTERVIMLSESLILTAQVAEALGYAHRQGVVHRDIKPDNIMLEPLDAPEREDEPAIRAVVTDFGLAKLLEGGLETQTNTFLGTLPYMSPEQCRGRNIDGRSDIYSLGILLYQLATGRLPFDIRSIGDAAEKHIRAIPPSPQEIRPDLPPAVADIILKAIEKQPEDRFQTGEEMARALRNVPVDDTKIMTMAQTTTQEIVSLVTQLLPEVSTFDPPSVEPGLVRPTAADYLLIQQRGQADYTHELEKAVMVIGRSEACDIVLDAAGISRQHARLERTTTGWQISDMGSSNGTWVKDTQLLPNIPETWEPGSTARIGPYFLQWQPGKRTAVQKQAHHPAFMKTPSHSGVTQLLTMDGQLGVMVDPTNAEVAPGGRTEVQVELSNQGSMVDHFELRVSGLPPEWVTLPSEPVQLMPGGSSLLPLSIHPPRTSSARAGRSAYQLFIYSASTRKRVAKIDGSVTVEPFTGFSFEARPTRLVNEGVCRVSLRNEGNSSAAFALSGSDPGEVIRFRGEQQSVTVPPGQSVELPLKVQPQKRPLFGKTEVHPFQLQVQSTTGESQQKQGVLEVRPRLPTWIMTIIPILIMICCIGGSVGAYAWFNYNQGIQQTETAVAELTARAQETPIGVVEEVTPGPDLAATQAALDAQNAQATAQAQAAQNEATSTALAFVQQTLDAQQHMQATLQAEQTATAQSAATQTAQAVEAETAAAATEQAAATATSHAATATAIARLVAHYPLTEDAVDVSGKQANATLENAPFVDESVYCNGIYSGSGASNACVISTPTLNGFDFNSFSIEVEFNAAVLRRMPVVVGGRSFRWIGFELNQDGSISLLYNNSNRESCSVSYEVDEWYTALLTYDGSQARLYLDGELGCTVSFNLNHGNDRDVSVINYSNGTIFMGNVRELKIYNEPIVPFIILFPVPFQVTPGALSPP
jgi:eukaryotic-like serine/threonine-protein kinase